MSAQAVLRALLLVSACAVLVAAQTEKGCTDSYTAALAGSKSGSDYVNAYKSYAACYSKVTPGSGYYTPTTYGGSSGSSGSSGSTGTSNNYNGGYKYQGSFGRRLLQSGACTLGFQTDVFNAGIAGDANAATNAAAAFNACSAVTGRRRALLSAGSDCNTAYVVESTNAGLAGDGQAAIDAASNLSTCLNQVGKKK